MHAQLLHHIYFARGTGKSLARFMQPVPAQTRGMSLQALLEGIAVDIGLEGELAPSGMWMNYLDTGQSGFSEGCFFKA